MERLAARWEQCVKWVVARRLPLAVGGAVVALLIVVYSDPVRDVVGWIWEHLLVGGALVLLVVAGVFAFAWWARGRTEAFGLSRGIRQERLRARRPVVARELEIGAGGFGNDLPEDQAVAGRRLRYLERETASEALVVLVPGLGLDAEEYRPVMEVTDAHTVAVTMFGMHAEDAGDDLYRPIGLTAQADLLNGVIAHLTRAHPRKRLHLVGFAVGADMLLRLGELWEAYPERKPEVASVLLLDPHVNHASMAITGSMAHLDPTAPLAELKRVAGTPGDAAEFRRVCEYLSKITEKDLNQIKQHARDLWEYTEPAGQYGQFLGRVEQLRAMGGTVRVCFSRRFEEYAQELAKLGPQRGLTGVFETRPLDHFQLTAAQPLAEELGPLTAVGEEGEPDTPAKDGDEAAPAKAPGS
jgi:hypothetical protein